MVNAKIKLRRAIQCVASQRRAGNSHLLGDTKFHVNRCNDLVAPAGRKKTDFRPVSKFNTDSLPLEGVSCVLSRDENRQRLPNPNRKPNPEPVPDRLNPKSKAWTPCRGLLVFNLRPRDPVLYRH